ncbi:hypothetical protein K469DRAFT_47301 [Zopfia rhizophila CBS 207.26]|uniref:Uncharacterized protein n=1 Tax=Zopfia rhizophila CBS 207.26 TaxID=1314779 RepID=A0A6A6EI06_9PEZI|nr:hypothetical protein K469DRAFT_47301 [Zopfia rhizophila CBS 207.26]
MLFFQLAECKSRQKIVSPPPSPPSHTTAIPFYIPKRVTALHTANVSDRSPYTSRHFWSHASTPLASPIFPAVCVAKGPAMGRSDTSDLLPVLEEPFSWPAGSAAIYIRPAGCERKQNMTQMTVGSKSCYFFRKRSGKQEVVPHSRGPEDISPEYAAAWRPGANG